MDLDQAPPPRPAEGWRSDGELWPTPARCALLSLLLIVVGVAGPCHAGEFDRFYPAAFAPGRADTIGAHIVHLAPGDSARGVDVQLENHAGALRGTVYGASTDGPVPLGDLIVVARSGPFLARTRTRADGVFTFVALPARKVFLHFATDDPTSSGRAYAALDAGPFEVSVGGSLELDAVTLLDGAVLAGSVLDAEGGAPLTGVRVEAVSDDGRVCAAHPPDPAGRFVLGGLVPGRFTARVIPEEGSPYLAEVLGGAREFEAAEFVELEPGESREVGAIELDRGAEVGGRIASGGVGRPLPDIVVELRPFAGGESEFVSTDNFGFYTFLGVPAGTYVLYVSALHRYYPDETRVEDARHLILGEGDVLLRIDVEGATQEECNLPPASQGVITGFADLDLSLVDTAVLRATSVSDTVDLTLEEAGFYTLACLPAGTYRVALIPEGPFLPQYHRKVQDPDRATLVVVDADTTAGVDFEPVKGICVGGHVLGAEGGGLSDVRVALLDSTLTEIAWTRSGEDGSYEICRRPDRSGVPSGRYYLRTDSTLVPGPDVTPIRQAYLRTASSSGEVVLSFGLPDGTRRARLERATDPLLFSANPGGTGVSEKVYEWAFEGGSSDAVFEIGDLPPHSGNWWYRLAAWGDFGESISIDGPVFVDRSSIRRLSVSIGPNPWGGTGPVRVFLAGHDGEGRRDELGERVAQSPSSEGTVALFDVTGRRIAEIPRVNTGSNDSLQLRGEIGSTRGVATGDPTSESIPEEFIEAIEWTPRDRAGRPLASGVYYLRWLDSLARERAQARWVVLR